MSVSPLISISSTSSIKQSSLENAGGCNFFIYDWLCRQSDWNNFLNSCFSYFLSVSVNLLGPELALPPEELDFIYISIFSSFTVFFLYRFVIRALLLNSVLLSDSQINYFPSALSYDRDRHITLFFFLKSGDP